MQSLLDGKMTRQQWWTGLSVLVALWLVWSLASDIFFTGPRGEETTALLSLVFLAPLAVLCARRLKDLEQAIWPKLALFLAPFILQTILTGLTDWGGRAASFETGISDSSAIVTAPSIAGWIVLAWLAAALAWMFVILGMRPGPDAEPHAEPSPAATSP